MKFGIFLDRVSENNLISSFMKIRSMGAEFFRADGRTDMTKLIGAFRSFCERAKELSPISGVTRNFVLVGGFNKFS
jgi:hypothetical protein